MLSPSWITALSWWRGLPNSMKLWAMPCRATQDGRVIVESSDKTWFTGEGNGKSLQYSCFENPMDSMKRQKEVTPEDEPPRLDSVQYATGEEQRAIAPARMKWLGQSRNDIQLWMCLVVKVVWCCKEQYCIGTWNVKSMNQGELDVLKQEMTRLNINILGISELKWIRMGDFNLDDHYIYYHR